MGLSDQVEELLDDGKKGGGKSGVNVDLGRRTSTSHPSPLSWLSDRVPLSLSLSRSHTLALSLKACRESKQKKNNKKKK